MIATRRIPSRVLAGFTPRPKVNSFDWICRHFRFEDGTPFDPDSYPWHRGICDEWDNPRRRTIWFQKASRIGGTAIAHALLMCAWATNPGPTVFGSDTESSAKRITTTETYPMLERCPELSDQLRPKHRRKQHLIEGREWRCYITWSGSVSSLAGIQARYGHGTEIDKWSTETSTEGDPLKLFQERAKNIPSAKFIFETTPDIRGRSRIERGLLRSTNCRFWVPCPHCRHYQPLVMGSDDPRAGGLVWDHDREGRSDHDLAQRTARYVCAQCHRDIHDEHRFGMMRCGVWVPQGCRVERGKVKGEPTRDGDDAGFQLSSLYAPTLTWGNIAREFVTSKSNPRDLQNFVNSWLGESWDRREKNTNVNDLASRLCIDLPLGRCPSWAVFLTAGVDVQIDHLVFVVVAWGQHERGHVVAYDHAANWDDLRARVLDATFAADGGGSLPIAATFVDSGHDTDVVYRFCETVNRPGRWVFPCRGSKPGALEGQPFRRSIIGQDAEGRAAWKNRMDNVERWLFLVNTNYWQTWIQRCLDTLRPGDAGSLSLPREAADDPGFLDDLLNETLTLSDDSRNYEKSVWERISKTVTVDFRDCLRYARCAAEVIVNRAWQRLPARHAAQAPPREPAVISPGASRPDGRPWI